MDNSEPPPGEARGARERGWTLAVARTAADGPLLENPAVDAGQLTLYLQAHLKTFVRQPRDGQIRITETESIGAHVYEIPDPEWKLGHILRDLESRLSKTVGDDGVKLKQTILRVKEDADAGVTPPRFAMESALDDPSMALARMLDPPGPNLPPAYPVR